MTNTTPKKEKVYRINVFRVSELGDTQTQPTITVCAFHLGHRKVNFPEFKYLQSDVPTSEGDECQDCKQVMQKLLLNAPKIIDLVTRKRKGY